MLRRNPLRVYDATVAGVAVASIVVGMLVASLTGHDVAVFLAQLFVAGLLAAWYPRMKKRSTASE